MASDIAENLKQISAEIAAAALRVGREPQEITLVGVSKTQPAEALAEAVRSGVRHIGENRVQEAVAKFTALPGLLGRDDSQPVRHLIGHLQTNKAAVAVELFDRVDSVDSLKVAQALGKRAGPQVLPVLLEIYVGQDPSRPGLRPEGLVDAVGPILEVSGVRVEGLMSIAPLGADARSAFRQVKALKGDLENAFPRVHFGVLSMGMSEDFSVAIEEGATEVRVGTALFGPRKPRP